MPLSLTELIAAVGDDHMRMSMLGDVVTCAKLLKDVRTDIRLKTIGIKPIDIIADHPDTIGVLIFLPGDRVREILADVERANEVSVEA